MSGPAAWLDGVSYIGLWWVPVGGRGGTQTTQGRTSGIARLCGEKRIGPPPQLLAHSCGVPLRTPASLLLDPVDPVICLCLYVCVCLRLTLLFPAVSAALWLLDRRTSMSLRCVDTGGGRGRGSGVRGEGERGQIAGTSDEQGAALQADWVLTACRHQLLDIEIA